MTIAYDNDSNSENDSTFITSETWSHTVNTINNTILIIGVSWRNVGAGTEEVSTVTYNSIECTKIRHDNYFNSSSKSSALYYLIDPSSGAHNIVVTMTGQVWRIVGGSISLTGVHQTDSINVNIGQTSASGNSVSTNITPTVSNTWIVDCVGGRDGSTDATPNSGQTQRWNYNESNTFHGMGSSKPHTDTSQTTMGWTLGTGTNGWAHSVIAITPIESDVQTHQTII